MPDGPIPCHCFWKSNNTILHVPTIKDIKNNLSNSSVVPVTIYRDATDQSGKIRKFEKCHNVANICIKWSIVV